MSEFNYYGIELANGMRIVTRETDFGFLLDHIESHNENSLVPLKVFDFIIGEFVDAAIPRNQIGLILTMNKAPEKIKEQMQAKPAIENPLEFLKNMGLGELQ